MDSLLNAVKNIIGGANFVAHDDHFDAKLKHIIALRDTIDVVNSAVEDFLLHEINYTETSITQDSDHFSTDGKVNLENHPKRKLSKVFCKASQTLLKTNCNSSILSKELNNFGILLASTAYQEEYFNHEFYQGFLKTTRNFIESNFEEFFNKVKELNQLKERSKSNEISKQYSESLRLLSNSADKLITEEKNVILPALIKLVNHKRIYLEESLKAANQFLSHKENDKSKRNTTILNKNKNTRSSFNRNSKTVDKVKPTDKVKSPKPDYSQMTAVCSEPVSALRHVERNEIIEDPEIYEFAVRSAMCEYLLAELDLEVDLDHVINEDSEPDDVSSNDDINEEKKDLQNVDNAEFTNFGMT